MVTEKILVVDDNKINRAVISKALKESYNIIEAENGKQALDILYVNDDVSAVLLDLEMPVMSGIEFLAAVRAIPSFAGLPIFVVTATGTAEDRTTALDMGANGFFEKMTKPNEIIEAVNSAVKDYRAVKDAQTDSLTGLLDRESVRTRIAAYVERMSGTDEKAALMILRVDNMLTDGAGFSGTADALVLFSQIIQKECNGTEIIGRLNVNEFVVLFKQIKKIADIEAAIKEILSDAEKNADGNEDSPVCSIGICVFSGDIPDISSLYQHTDSALKAARLDGDNKYRFFEGDRGASSLVANSQAMRLLDETGMYIFVCDVKTNEILFMNTKCSALIAHLSNDERPCVCSLLGIDEEPCGLCVKHSLSADHYYGDTVTTKNKKTFGFRIKLIDWYGKLAKLMIINETIK